MRQIYINTMLGTTRIDYNPNDDTDIIIVRQPAQSRLCIAHQSKQPAYSQATLTYSMKRLVD
jgi:hypothetical protein